MEAQVLVLICVAIANLAATVINALALNKASRDHMAEKRKEKADAGSDSIR